MHLKHRKITYYHVRAEWLWGGIFCLLLLSGIGIWEFGLLTRQQEPPSVEGQLRVEVTYDDWRSELTDTSQCLLCGETAQMQMDARKSDTIGLLFLNDWIIVDFPLKASASEGEGSAGSDPGVHYRSTGEATCLSSGDPSRGMARVEASWPEGYALDSAFLQQNLCASCLSQIADALSFFKWEKEDKEAIPLCLIDFQTRELYPVQDSYRAYFIRDYWVDMDFSETSVTIKAYDLPRKDVW